METAMNLIAGAGDSRSFCVEAIGLAREGDFTEARRLIEKAVETMIMTHEAQTQLIRDEIDGKAGSVTLLMAHAQDHLNLALITRDMAEEMILLYERISKLEVAVHAPPQRDGVDSYRDADRRRASAKLS